MKSWTGLTRRTTSIQHTSTSTSRLQVRKQWLTLRVLVLIRTYRYVRTLQAGTGCTDCSVDYSYTGTDTCIYWYPHVVPIRTGTTYGYPCRYGILQYLYCNTIIHILVSVIIYCTCTSNGLHTLYLYGRNIQTP